MRKSAVIFSLIAFCLSSCSSISENSKQLIGQPAPYTRVTFMDGTYTPLDDWKGKNICLVFWTTWCPHSRESLIEFNTIAASVTSSNYVFVDVNLDAADKLEEVKKRIEFDKLNALQHAFSGNDISDEAYISLRGDSLPYYVGVDSDGIVRVVSNTVSDIKSLCID